MEMMLHRNSLPLSAPGIIEIEGQTGDILPSKLQACLISL